MRTFVAKKEKIKPNWYIVDATDKILGRLATELVIILRGKHKVEYTPHVDVGDYVVVINAKKIIVTGNKRHEKIYYHHTRYTGGIKKIKFKDMIINHPEKIIKMAVKGMLPKGPLGRVVINKLKIFSDENHCHMAQKPQIYNLYNKNY